jgi:hypothetical protein
MLTLTAAATMGVGQFDCGSPTGWKMPVSKRTLAECLNHIVGPATAGRFIIERKS